MKVGISFLEAKNGKIQRDDATPNRETWERVIYSADKTDKVISSSILCCNDTQ